MHCGVNASLIFLFSPVSDRIDCFLKNESAFRRRISSTLTSRHGDVTPIRMQNRSARGVVYGPWLVGLGAALWGTESAWRIPLNKLFDAKVIVFWEHVLILIMFLPLLLVRLGEVREIRARTWGYLLFSGFAGSAVGTVFFTLALKYGNPTVVNVILNIQPVISTLGAFLLFNDRLARRFFFYAGIAIVSGIFVSVAHPTLIGVSFERAGLNLGTGYVFICALFWGISTVAGRGVMIGMSLRLASSMRIVVGLACMTVILLAYGKLNGAALWPVAAQAHATKAIVWLILLASVSGGIPLLIYFEGLRLTRASTAGYFEMMQTLAAVCVTWGFFHASLYLHQVIAAIALIVAVAMVHHVQQHVERS
jgi:drug/metabolite transporter, DME family